MKKLLIVSDSHGNPEALLRAVGAEWPVDMLFFLGDGQRDLEQVRLNYPELPVYSVKGNCDYAGTVPAETEVTVEQVRFFLTHGNRYGVKNGTSLLAEAARRRGADVALFGHTHRAYTRYDNGVLLFNPGSVGESRGGSGTDYGVMVVQDNTILRSGVFAVPKALPTLPMVYLPEVGSTNDYLKQNPALFDGAGVVYSGNQTAGKGRLGRQWVNAAGQALYYSILLRQPLVQPSTLPLLASLVTADAIEACFGVSCTIKWPNDLLLNGKKVVGILCESVGLPQGSPVQRAWIAGIGTNLAQPQRYFDAANLPYGTSLALQGVVLEPDALRMLARQMTLNFEKELPRFGAEGFAPYRQRYCDRCVNLGRNVTFTGGSGLARTVDEDGNLQVETPDGTCKVFTGEVSVGGIYGTL